jgi:transcriptional regulator with XRE-family HTH domain
MNTVREHREARGMSRETLAVRASVSYSYISQLEARAGRDDEPTPGIDVARRLAEALGVSDAVLFPPATVAAEAPSPVEAK